MWAASSILVRALALSTSLRSLEQGCQHLLRGGVHHKWGPAGGGEIECACYCGECDGPAHVGQPPACTTPPPPPTVPPMAMPPPPTPPPPPPLAPLAVIPTLEEEHLPTLAPGPVAPPEPWRYPATTTPAPPPNATNATFIQLHSEARVRRAAASLYDNPRLRFCAMLLQKQLPPTPTECNCECPPCNLAQPTPLLCDPKLPPTTPAPKPEEAAAAAAPGTPPPPQPTPAAVPPMAPLDQSMPIGLDALPPLEPKALL